MPSLLY